MIIIQICPSPDDLLISEPPSDFRVKAPNEAEGDRTPVLDHSAQHDYRR